MKFLIHARQHSHVSDAVRRRRPSGIDDDQQGICVLNPEEMTKSKTQETPGTFWDQVKERKLRKRLAIYVSTALSILGVSNLFRTVYQLPTTFFNIILILLVCGLPTALLIAWYHGGRERQKIRKREIVFHSLIAIMAGFLIFKAIYQPPRPQLAPLRDVKSIAVLPFVNLSDNKEDEYFSDGMTEDILLHLSKIGDLRVISRTSAMKYKGSNKSIREIADELGVAAILEGSVRRAGSRIRIVGQLIDAQADEYLWAETYDREFQDVFAIQTEVAQTIAGALRAKLSPREQERINKRATTNLEAYAYYLRGRDYYNRVTREDNEKAIELFRKAAALDSTYALAVAGIADAYAQRFQRYGFEERWVDSSIALSQHAITLDPEIPEPYKSLALAYYQREWYRKAMEQNRKAIELNPNFAVVYSNMGEILDWTGRHDEALELIKKAMKLQPGRASDHLKLGAVYFSLGMDSSALAHILKSMELQPSYTTAYANLSEVYLLRGDAAKARSLLDSVMALYPDDFVLKFAAANVELHNHRYESARDYYLQVYNGWPEYFGVHAPLGFTLLKTGRAAEGNKMLDLCVETIMKSIESGSEEGYRRYDLARVAAIRGDTTAALQWLARALEMSSALCTHSNTCDPLLENLYGNAEYHRLMNLNSRKLDAMRARVEEQERAEQEAGNNS